jgi:hypothetical protein
MAVPEEEGQEETESKTQLDVCVRNGQLDASASQT